jgi:tetratricopeptide (TPR) repeat protein
MSRGETRLAAQILDEVSTAEQEVLRLNPRHQEGRNTLAEYYSTRARLEGERGQTQFASHPIEEAIRPQTQRLLQHPVHPEFLSELFESLVVWLSLDGKPGREAAAERIAEIRRMLQQLLRQIRDDPKNTWAVSQAVGGYRALAEHSLASGTPAGALALLDEAPADLGRALNTSRTLLSLRAHEVRLRTLRGEILRRIGKTDEAAIEAKQAAALAEKLVEDDPSYLVDVAYAYALQARLDPTSPALLMAVKALQAAVDQGFDNVYKLEHDDRLAPLRPRDDFRALIQRVKERAAKAAPGGGR